EGCTAVEGTDPADCCRAERPACTNSGRPKTTYRSRVEAATSRDCRKAPASCHRGSTKAPTSADGGATEAAATADGASAESTTPPHPATMKAAATAVTTTALR